jgi:hypothetical protein
MGGGLGGAGEEGSRRGRRGRGTRGCVPLWGDLRGKRVCKSGDLREKLLKMEAGELAFSV